MVLSHLRFAAGVCVLAAGLLMGGAGGAVAVADPDSSSSAAHGDDGTNASGQQHSTDAKKPKDERARTPRTARWLGRAFHRREKPRTKEPGGTDTDRTDARHRQPAPPPRNRRHRIGNRRHQLGNRAAQREPAPPQRQPAPPTEPAPPQRNRRRHSGTGAPHGNRRRRSGTAPPLRHRRPTAATGAPAAATGAPAAAPAPRRGGAGPQWGGAGSPTRRRRLPMRRRRFPMWSAPVSDVIALVQDMLTPVAGAVVPLTQLQSDLYSFLLGIAGAPVPNLVAQFLTSSRWFRTCSPRLPVRSSRSRNCSPTFYSFLLGIAGVQPVVAGLGGVAGAGLSAAADASVASQWRLVLALAGIPGGPLAGNAHRGCNARGDCGIHFRRDDGTASAQWRHSDGCAVVFPACRQRTPATRVTVGAARRRRACDPYRSRGATRFTGGAGRSRSARRRRAGDPYRSRGARRIPPGQSRFRIADSGHRALRPSGGRSVRCRPFGVIGCRPSEGIARRPSGGVKRRMSSR